LNGTVAHRQLKHCVLLRNSSSSRSIIAALECTAIAGLSSVWDSVPRRKIVQLESMKGLFNSDRGYFPYRLALHRSSAPAVPILDHFLNDITSYHKNNASHFQLSDPRIADGKRLINFYKFSRIATILQGKVFGISVFNLNLKERAL
jgi:son of sevenless